MEERWCWWCLRNNVLVQKYRRKASLRVISDGIHTCGGSAPTATYKQRQDCTQDSCVCVCVIPPHIQTVDVDSTLFVQCIHRGSYYGCPLNSCLSTSSDLFFLFLFFSPFSWGPSSSFIPLFSSFSGLLCSACAPSFPSGAVIILCSLTAFS